MIRNWVAGLCSAAVLVTGCAGNNVFRTEEELRQRSSKPVATTIGATVTKAAALRTGPDAEMPATVELPAGATVTASETVSRGFRRVTTADGKTGFVAADALQLGSGGGANQAPAAK